MLKKKLYIGFRSNSLRKPFLCVLSIYLVEFSQGSIRLAQPWSGQAWQCSAQGQQSQGYTEDKGNKKCIHTHIYIYIVYIFVYYVYWQGQNSTWQVRPPLSLVGPRSHCLAVRKCSYIHKCMVPIAGHLGPIGAQWLQGQGHHRGRALLLIQKQNKAPKQHSKSKSKGRAFKVGKKLKIQIQICNYMEIALRIQLQIPNMAQSGF